MGLSSKRRRRSRDELMGELRRDKPQLQQARDLWHTYTPEQMTAVMRTIVNAHSKVLGIEPPRGTRLSGIVKGAHWDDEEREIVVGRATSAYRDFEFVMSVLFHENSHNWQHRLADGQGRSPPAIAAGNPLYNQAMLFEANMHFYNTAQSEWNDYKLQPLEVHAYRAGDKFTSALLRMLES